MASARLNPKMVTKDDLAVLEAKMDSKMGSLRTKLIAENATLGDRHHDPLLVNVKPDICEYDLPCQSGATLATCYCEMGPPRSGGHVV
jgi:hypothetical protein